MPFINQATAQSQSAHFCATCNKSFKKAKTLARHLATAKTHAATQTRHFCTVPGCTSSMATTGTTRQDEISKHMRQFHPELLNAGNQNAANSPSNSAVSGTTVFQPTSASGAVTSSQTGAASSSPSSSRNGDSSDTDSDKDNESAMNAATSVDPAVDSIPNDEDSSLKGVESQGGF
ncbi:hypothetical protein GE09DRAFT_59143 [Coniochaeta sp. 2T2.1]|nr:hypothetical protein GE09DRAFT_59143 [Coniochaeta sp. 2T2.1]